MGLCSWDTCWNGPSYMGRMRLPLRSTVHGRFLQLRIINFKRHHLRFLPPLFPRRIRSNASSSERLPRHPPNHYNLQRHLSFHLDTSNEPTDMDIDAYPRILRIHSNRLRIESEVTTARLGMGIRFLRPSYICELLGI